RAQVVGLSDLGEVADIRLYISPDRPIALLRHTRFVPRDVVKPGGSTDQSFEAQHTLYILREDGRLGAHVELPPPGMLSEVRWSAEGVPVLSRVHMDRSQPK